MMIDVELRTVGLKEFEVKKYRFPGSTIPVWMVTCPNCGDTFWVRKTWKKLRRSTNRYGQTTYFITKSCTYCFKVSMLPRRWWPKRVKEAHSKKRKAWDDYFKSDDLRRMS